MLLSLKHELSIFSEFLTAIHDCKTRVIEALYDRLSNHVIDEFLSTSITKIDELSTHHYVEDIWINEVYIEEINDTNIDIKVDGSIYVEMQYGSSSDLRNDNGVLLNNSFPFRAMISIDAFHIDEFKVSEYSCDVNTTSWRE